ncbi:MAG: CDP-alcohol phosphatidyltransferase family protein [Gemmatimonadales bacterium]
MLANWITLARFPMLVITVLLFYLGSPVARLAGVGLLFVGLMLDTVDGAVARRTGRTSLFGSVLDIAADRTYELVLWVCFADLRLIPTAIPLIVLGRTTLTDALRAIGVGRGEPPFAQQRSALGRLLVGSSWMRTGYAAGKLVTFCGLALVQAGADFPPATLPGRLAVLLLEPLRLAAWLTVALCLLRGLPVIIGSLRRYWRRAALVDAPDRAR